MYNNNNRINYNDPRINPRLGRVEKMVFERSTPQAAKEAGQRWAQSQRNLGTNIIQEEFDFQGPRFNPRNRYIVTYQQHKLFDFNLHL